MMMRTTLGIVCLSIVLCLAGCGKGDQGAKAPAADPQTTKLAAEPLKFPTIFDAAKVGDTDDVKRHMARGFNPSSVDGESYTPLHYAASGGYAATCQALLDKGADVNITTKDGLTALHCAAMTGNAETATALLARGAKVEAPDNNQMTPLCTAALKGNVPVADVLLRAGANVNYMATTQWTPLRVAEYGKQPAMIDWLKSHGATQ
jgi:ankyrin repeat protein